MTSALKWFKSSYSGSDDADCVEIAIPTPDPTVHVHVHVRDSKDPQGTPLAFADGAWAEFVTFARRSA
ncbi:DUF397 domain-containing protein [Streptomyces spongiae]|uniref:DUF397 domain-containing protein n=1 Tax=Streptomyces spongiae TaxID=565072 RepID=A0A5N8XQ47_9ACTN|nr:DUF397 domain-containing protein [Streptomyces spongiae]MPY61088.1 DUF397 domain-containing protein [Streptomyces spongiae]